MSADEAEVKLQRMRELVSSLNEFAREYYTLDSPSISDTEYDLLYDELRLLEKEMMIVLPGSPTQRVGSDISGEFKKHTHLTRLWSLDKAQSEKELLEWEKRIKKMIREYAEDRGVQVPEPTYIMTLKFDGLTINLTYEAGALKQAATRGTGEIGEAILPQAKTIKNIPQQIKAEEILEVRGEALMTKQAFLRYNEKAAVPLKNLRNGAAGALRNLDVRETARRSLEAFFYDIGFWNGAPFSCYEKMLEFLGDQGLPVHPYHKKYSRLEDAFEEIKRISAERDQYDFEIDGLVIVVNENVLREILGYTIKFPRWAIAYKFEAKEAETLLLEVEWNVGRSGKVTPTAILEPVELGGITIKRATLNNPDDILRKGVRLGVRIIVRRANDVIPEIVGIANEQEGAGREIELPSNCPACASVLIRDGVHLFCENTLSCKPQMVKSIVHFASREAMNIEGFNEKTALQFFEELAIREIADLYSITREQLLGLEKFKEKKAEKVLSALEKSKECTLDAFVFALGIPNVGKKTAHDLALEFETLQELAAAETERLQSIPEIGIVVAQSIRNFFSDPRIREGINKLLAVGIDPRPLTKASPSGVFAGKNVVVTGSLEKYTRTEIEKRLTAMGAAVSTAVGKKTDYLIAGENPGSKMERALQLIDSGENAGLKIISEEQFESLSLS